jgi:porin
VYEVNPELQEHGHRFALGSRFAGAGRRWVSELGWLPASAGPAGGYRVGAWYDNGGGDDLFLNEHGKALAVSPGTPLRRHQQSGFYAMAQQQVWTKAGRDARGASVFANFVQADRQITVKDQIAEIGLLWKGPLDYTASISGGGPFSGLMCKSFGHPAE